jgi:hypothetical protein
MGLQRGIPNHPLPSMVLIMVLSMITVHPQGVLTTKYLLLTIVVVYLSLVIVVVQATSLLVQLAM